LNIVLVGEAWGQKEEEEGRPFVGASGWLLNQMLSHAGIRREECFTTNVFNLRPKPSNDIKNLCGSKADGIVGFPALAKGQFVLAQYAPEIDRLYREIRERNPNLIVALGATAAWALLYSTGIKTIRGAVAPTHHKVSAQLGRTYKVLPTYHPAMVLRDYSARPVATADLGKAARESLFPEVRRPKRSDLDRPHLGRPRPIRSRTYPPRRT
jgi:uracil-DNA glycosylase